MGKQIQDLSDKVDSLNKKLDEKFDNLYDNLAKNYVSQREFAPIKMVIYGTIGTIVTGFITAILYIVGWRN